MQNIILKMHKNEYLLLQYGEIKEYYTVPMFIITMSLAVFTKTT